MNDFIKKLEIPLHVYKRELKEKKKKEQEERKRKREAAKRAKQQQQPQRASSSSSSQQQPQHQASSSSSQQQPENLGHAPSGAIGRMSPQQEVDEVCFFLSSNVFARFKFLWFCWCFVRKNSSVKSQQIWKN